MQQTNQQIVTKSELKATKATLQTLPNIQQICCRICLQDMSPEETFAVCKCKGANSHVHQKCLLQWAKKTQKYRESLDMYYYHCQICKDKILLEVVTKLKCLKCRQISLCGDDSCCTFSALTILFMGLAMFIAGLYLKITTENSDIEYLFDITLSLAVVIISFDLVLSILYFLLYNEIAVVGILLTEEQRARIKLKELKVSNAHQEGENDSKRAKKQRDQNINQTEEFFIQDNNAQQVRQILDDARFQTLNRQQQQNQSPPRQRILFPENQNPTLPTNQQPLLPNPSKLQSQNIKPKQQPLILDSQPDNQTHAQNQQSLPQNINNQSFIRNELQNINQHDYSASTVLDYQTRSIMVKSISVQSRGDYINNLSNYNSTPMNDQSSTFSNIENEISHNQIPTPKSMMVKKPNPLSRFRKTLDESMVRSQIHLREQKQKYYGYGSNEKVSEEEQEVENDVELYFVETSNKKLIATIQNSSSKKFKPYEGNSLSSNQQQHQ